MNGKRAYGDYQTPEYFSLAVCEYLKNEKQVTPSVIIEPTCGTGSFVKSSLIFNVSEVIGIEINSEYCEICKKNIPDPRVRIINADFFTFDFKTVVKREEQLLIIGNAPDTKMLQISPCLELEIILMHLIKSVSAAFIKNLFFSVLASSDGIPMMTDDTSYFICFPTYDTAYVAMLILNSIRVQQFLSTIAFLDAKRPYTKKVLKQIDFQRILPSIQFTELAETEKALGLKKYVNQNMLSNFHLLPELSQKILSNC